MNFFSCLVSVALFPLFAIIFENKSDVLGIKSLILRVHLAIFYFDVKIQKWNIVSLVFDFEL